MPSSACCSAIASGVAMSVHLYFDHAVLDGHREGVHRYVGGQGQGLSGLQVEQRAVARALDRALVAVDLALHQLAVVVRAAIPDRVQLAAAVHAADLEVLPGHDLRAPGGQLVNGADVDQRAQSPTWKVGFQSSDGLGAGRPPAVLLGGARGGLGLPARGLAEPGALEHLQGQQRALDARGGDVDAEQVEHEAAVQPQQVVDGHPDHLVGGHRGRRLRDRAAVAGEAQVGDLAVAVDLDLDLQLVPAERVVVLELEVGVLQLAPVVRLLVVLEDLLAIEIIHQANTSSTGPRPSTRRSTSSRVEWIAKLARDVAPTPRRRISGCAQWWPARTQMPWRPRISATSCGWMPSSANDTAAPWI